MEQDAATIATACSRLIRVVDSADLSDRNSLIRVSLATNNARIGICCGKLGIDAAIKRMKKPGRRA